MSEYPEFMSDGEQDEGMFAFNPNASASSVRVGKCPIAVTVADNVLLRPRELADFGLGLEFVEDGSNLYPGVRARVPAEFSRPFCAWLTRSLHRTGVLEEGSHIHDDASFFSIVDKSRANLLPLQRIPHYDSSDPRVFAAVIYLFDRANSGTVLHAADIDGSLFNGNDNCRWRLTVSSLIKSTFLPLT